MKSWILTAAVVLVGLILGWFVTLYGLSQPWWPLPVSGRSEILASGTLRKDPSGTPTGLYLVDSADRKTYVDLSRVSSKSYAKSLNSKVTVRGQVLPSFPTSYLLVSWIK